jgi:hypothetical protein
LRALPAFYPPSCDFTTTSRNCLRTHPRRLLSTQLIRKIAPVARTVDRRHPSSNLRERSGGRLMRSAARFARRPTRSPTLCQNETVLRKPDPMVACLARCKLARWIWLGWPRLQPLRFDQMPREVVIVLSMAWSHFRLLFEAFIVATSWTALPKPRLIRHQPAAPVPPRRLGLH